MSNNNVLKHIGVLSFVLCCCFSSLGQSQKDTTNSKGRGEYSLVAYVGGGISFFTGVAGTPANLKATVNKTNPTGTLRIMWHPDHLLRVGLETGWVNFYSYTINDNGIKGATHVRAIPILFVFSMPLGQRINLFSGSGSYLVKTDLNYNGQLHSGAHSLGWMLAASYVQPVTSNIGIAGECKWLNAAGTKDAALTVQLQLRWKFFRW